MKILFVHEVSYLKKPIYEVHEFPELLALRGHEVSFFEFDEGRKFWKKHTAIRDNSTVGRVHPEANIKIFRPLQLGIPGLDRIFALFSSIPKLKILLDREKFDAIVLYAVPTFGIQTILFARAKKIPVMFRALDVTHKIRKSIFSSLIKVFEGYVYKHSDLLSSNNLAMQEYCVTLSGRKKGSIVHFPPLDLEHFRKATRNPKLRELLGIRPEEKVIVYMGSFFYFSGLGDAIQEFARIGSRENSVKLLLIGGGEQDSELRALAKRLGVPDRVIFTGMIPYNSLPDYLAVADLAINTLESSMVANAALPNKVLQYLAAGLPVVSTNLRGLATVFDDEDGITWAPSSASVMREAITLITGLTHTSLPSTKKGLEKNLMRFSPQITVDELEGSIKDMLSKLEGL